MKTHALLAIILIATGFLAFAYQGFTYTTREKVVDLGPVQMTTERKRTVPLPPILGAVALLSGAILLIKGGKNS